jgi:AsmA protein
VNFVGERPAIDGTLGLKALDLSKYFPAAAPQGASLLSLIADASGFEFPLIEAVDADLRLSSDSLVAPGVTIGRSAATISLKGGKMIADIAELEIDEGTRGGGQMRIDVNGAQPVYEIHGKLESLDLGRAGQAVFGHSTVQGRGDVTVDITGTGDNGAALLQSLNGKLCATLTEGGQLGLDVDQLVSAAPTPQAQSVWPAASHAAVAIDTADLRFAVANGVLRAENAEAVTGSRAMKAVGSINLPLSLLDLQFAAGERARAEAKPGQRPTVKVSGPWAQPSLQPAADLPPSPPPRLDTASPANPG